MSGDTIWLDPVLWDVGVDEFGNIRIMGEPDISRTDQAGELAQDAASAIKLFLGELYYDKTQGVPYFEQILGKVPPLRLLKAKLIQAAMTVPGVVKAQVFLTQWDRDRTPTGQVQVFDTDGNLTVASF